MDSLEKFSSEELVSHIRKFNLGLGELSQEEINSKTGEMLFELSKRVREASFPLFHIKCIEIQGGWRASVVGLDKFYSEAVNLNEAIELVRFDLRNFLRTHKFRISIIKGTYFKSEGDG